MLHKVTEGRANECSSSSS